MEPLRALGLSAPAEALLLDLLQHPDATPAELAAQHDDVDASLEELAGLGLVERTGDALTVRPPRLAMEALAERHTQQAALARDSAETLSELWKAAAGKQDYLEVLPTYAASQAVLNSVQTDAHEQVRAMTTGNLAARELRIVDGMFEALERGARYDVIYGAHVLQDANALHLVQACIDAGETARVFPHVPLNITIVDNRWALVGARSEVRRGPEFTAVVVHDSPLLAGLARIFEALWRIAVPITGGTELNDVTAGPSLDAKRLLTYLSAGLTDESIAREFGVSERTIARRIGRLQEALGAQTRFQLGVQASRQGWL
ncbi:regulatory LuxR family protein [Kribbella steppae]|uniref:Regulatory LuxR family protein n=1 Tax=Kribbella steppae TaxID=2512223 RepID=A0A4R2GTL9_9ACTN|nr:LuxR family transcriptional regulator [Kribbella steppae]TCO13863.1 regulatory LuxR family protein [Kribbella steppae]